MVEEGIHLRKNGVNGIEILVFSRLSEESVKAVLEFRLTPVLSSWADLELLRATSSSQAISVHVKFNTGMHRMGFSPEDVPSLREFFSRETKVKCVGMGTHLSHGEDVGVGDGRSQRQIQLFRRIFLEMGMPNVHRHVLNSSGLLSFPVSERREAEWLGARPGLALYGLCESSRVQPAMSLLTRLDLVRRVKKNESVSYGGRWTASKESWIGIVPIGYGDGYFRALSNRAEMLFRGRRVPVVGTICMDYSLLDLTEVCRDGEPKAGEDIVVFGQDITVIELTRKVDTIPYELVTCLSARVPREYR
jgi:alanine racemase